MGRNLVRFTLFGALFFAPKGTRHGPHIARTEVISLTSLTDLKIDAHNPADREKLRRAVLDLVAGRKMPKQK